VRENLTQSLHYVTNTGIEYIKMCRVEYPGFSL
jgi:hypothetical protein